MRTGLDFKSRQFDSVQGLDQYPSPIINEFEIYILSIRDCPYWTSRENSISIQLIELTHINKFNLVYVFSCNINTGPIRMACTGSLGKTV
jgi:hypothetical protein